MELASMFEDFSDDSKCWVFGFKNMPNLEQLESVSADVSEFLKEWRSHGKAISSSHSILENRFLVLVANGSSGCSIDSMRKDVSSILNQHKIELSDFTDVFWKNDDNLNCSSRSEFSEILKKQTVEYVYDLSLSALGSLKTNGLSKEYKDSWAAKAFA